MDALVVANEGKKDSDKVEIFLYCDGCLWELKK
jgi:hypothetical protein